MSSTHFERPPRTNAPMQPRNGEKKMELVECQTCGAHSMTNGKCDYCGNQYDLVSENKIFYSNSKEVNSMLNEVPKRPTKLLLTEELGGIDFAQTETGQKITKVLTYILISIIWFAVTVFIPPLFIITIILLVVYSTYRLTKRNK